MQLIVSGIVFGCIYGLTALGIVLIFRTTDVVNFSQGEMAMFSTFVSYVFLTQIGMPYAIAFLLALGFSAILGIGLYLGVMKWIQSSSPLHKMIVTLGLNMILNGLAGFIWGRHASSYPLAVEGESMKLGTAFVTPNELFILGITLALMLIFFFIFRYSKVGLAMRAASQDMTASKLMGIKVSRVFMWTWCAGSVMGGVAGMMTAPLTFLDTNMMLNVLVMSFAAAVLGGFVSLPGVVIGGVIVAVFENLVSYYLSPELKLSYIFVLIIVILYVCPQGIFGGSKFVKKV